MQMVEQVVSYSKGWLLQSGRWAAVAVRKGCLEVSLISGDTATPWLLPASIVASSSLATLILAQAIPWSRFAATNVTGSCEISLSWSGCCQGSRGSFDAVASDN